MTDPLADALVHYAAAMAVDPCAARGHTCRCFRPLPANLAVDDLGAVKRAEEDRFRALFTPAAPARRERLAELDALTDQIEPLLDRLDRTWRAVETDLGWHPRRAAL